MNKKWIKTDDMQFVRKKNEKEFEVIDISEPYNGTYFVCHSMIDLDDYSSLDIEKHLKPYGYNGIKEVSEIYGASTNQIIAECIAELEPDTREMFRAIEDVHDWLISIDEDLDIFIKEIMYG